MKGDILSKYLKEGTIKAGIRAGKTIADAAIAVIGTSAELGQVDWPYVLSASVLAGIMSILTSVAFGLPEVEAKKYE